jgi:hypothetical protein
MSKPATPERLECRRQIIMTTIAGPRGSSSSMRSRAARTSAYFRQLFYGALNHPFDRAPATLSFEYPGEEEDDGGKGL